MPSLTAVDFDPFAQKPRAAAPRLTPVDHDPFGEPGPTLGDVTTLDPVVVRPPADIAYSTTGDYGDVFAEPVEDPSTFGKIGLRALVGRIPELIANTIELPANANEALIRSTLGEPSDTGIFATMRGLLRSGAEGVREIGYEPEMAAAGYGVPSVSGGDVVEAINPTVDLPLGERAARVGRFIPETLLASAPDMAATLNPATLAGYIGSRTNEIAEDRAANDLREAPTLGDLAIGGVAAPVEALLERFTTMRLLPKGTTMSTPGVVPAIARIAKELGLQGSLGGVEELVPYLAETVGTETGASGQGALESFVGGALAEGGLGAGVQTAKEATRAALAPRAPPAAAAETLGKGAPPAPIQSAPAAADIVPQEATGDLGEVLATLPPETIEAALQALGDPESAAAVMDVLGGVAPEPAPEPAADPVVDALARQRRPETPAPASLPPAKPEAVDVAPPAESAQPTDIGAALQARIEAEPDAVAAQYDAIEETDGGRVLNTDLARELSPEYTADRTRSADVHEAASAFVKRRYAEKLAQPTPEGMEPVVMFTAGGTGAGKTTAIRETGDAFGRPEIVYDTNMNTLASAEQKVQQALDSGRTVRIAYVYRDPVEALTGGAIARAKRMAAEKGTGRTVPLAEHAKTHAGVRSVMDALAAKYQGDPRVEIVAIDNSRGRGNSQMVDLESLPPVEETTLRERLRAALEEARSGGLDEAIYRGFAAEGRPADSAQGQPAGVGSGDGRRTEQERPPVTPAPADVGAASRPEPSAERQLPTPVDDLSRALDRIVSSWRGDAPLVRYLQYADELPAAAKRGKGWEETEGWYDGRSTVYLVASNIPNSTRGEQVLAHEAFGHFGVEGVVGKAAWAEVLADVERLKRRRVDLSADLKAALASAERRYGNENPAAFAREFLAVAAERGVRGTWMDRLLAALRTGLRKLGFDVEAWTESTLRSVLAKGARSVERGDVRRDREAGLPGFSRPAAAASPTPAPTQPQSRNTNAPNNPDDVRDADRAPPVGGALERQRQAIEDQVDGLRQFLRGRPKNPKGLGERLNDIRSAVFDSVMSRARDLERNNRQSVALPELFDLVMAAPGESRLVGETVNDAVQSRFATFTNRARNILGNNGLDRMSDIENAQLRAAMLGTETKGPANIKAAASQLRRLMDVQREDMIAAGLDVGEVTDIGYLTRIYDEAKILDDRDGFLSKATELFEKHEFALDVGSNPSEIMYGEGSLARFLGYARRTAASDPAVEAKLDEIKRLLRRYRSTSNVNNETRQIQRIVGEIHDRVRRDWAKMRAAAWLHGINTPDVRSFASGVSPSGAPITKARELSGAADTVMAPYLKTDMLDILDSYARTAARKIEHATRFGPDGSRLQELIDQASAEGVSREDMDTAIRLVDSVLGLNARQPETSLKQAADFLHAWTYLALLGRATFSSLAEAVTFTLRTGQLRHTVAPLVQIQRAITRSKRGRELRELAQVIAVNGNKAVEDVIMNRLGGDYSMTPKWSALLHRFFYATLLTPLTRAQRAYGVGAATGFLRKLAGDVKSGHDPIDTAALLNEVGIADHEAFADWMLAQGPVPDGRTLFDENGRPTPRGQDYMVAVRRIIDQSIQNPGAEHRPAWTNNPAGRLVTGIMSFSYASYENIIKREAALMARNLRDQGRMKALERNAIALTGAAALVLAQTLTSTLRELLFNADRFEDKDDDEIAEEMVALGLSRTFGLGSADPIVQYLTGLKYQRTLAETALGAGPGLVAQALDRGGMLFTDRNSPNTDTAEFRFYQSVWAVALAPALNIILSRIPIVGGPAIMVASGSDTQKAFAEQFAKRPEPKSHLDTRYQEASAELDEVLGVVNDRIAALPEEQWQDELDKLKEEYPSILAGVTLDVYADNPANRKKGRVGKPKTAGHEGKPGLKLQGPEKEGEGSVLGELEGYQHYDRFKKRYVSGEGIRDNITALNKAIKNLQSDDDVTIADLMAFARQAPSVEPLMDEYWTADAAETEKPASRRLVNRVLDELLELRREEKRRALEVIEKGSRGEPIKRGEAAER